MSLKLWGYLGAFLTLSAGVAWFGIHERGVGAAGVQVAWDAEKAKASDATARQAYTVAQTQSRQLNTFAGIAATYHEAVTDGKKSAPTISAADISAGRVRLRSEWQCASGYVRTANLPQAPISGPEADAASVAASEQRSQGASDLVRIADEADKREQQLGAQVSALQSTLNAERSP